MKSSSVPQRVTVESGDRHTLHVSTSPFTLEYINVESAHGPMYKSRRPEREIQKDWGWRRDGNFTTTEWKAGRRGCDPVSQSGGTTIRLKVTILYKPIRDESVAGYLEGTPEESDNGAFQFPRKKCCLRTGRNRIVVHGEKPLPAWPGRQTARIRWTFQTLDHQKFFLGTSGPHTVFVTFGAPRREGEPEDGASVQRMKEATRRVGKIPPCSGPELLHKLLESFPNFVLGRWNLSPQKNQNLDRNPELWNYMQRVDWPRFWSSNRSLCPVSVPEHLRNMMDRVAMRTQGGAWPLAELYNFGGECQAIARFVRGIAMQLGLPGTFNVKYVTSRPPASDPAVVQDPATAAPTGYGLVPVPIQPGRYPLDSVQGFLNQYEAYLHYRYTTEDGRALQTWYSGGCNVRVTEPQTDTPSEETVQTLLGVFSGVAEYRVVGDQASPICEITKYHPFSWTVG